MTKTELLEAKEEMLALMDSIGYSNSVINQHSFRISLFINYLVANSKSPNIETMEEFISYICAQKSKPSGSYYWQTTYNSCNHFIRFLEDGIVTSTTAKRLHNLCGGYAEYMLDFIEEVLYKQRHLHSLTVNEYRRSLNKFNDYIKNQNYKLDSKAVIDYFIYYGEQVTTSNHSLYATKVHLSSFLEYLYEQGITETLLTKYLPNVKYVRNEKLPSVFTEAEIRKMIASINRESRVGKRDYAIVMLALRYGFRAHDIAMLEFANINWDSNEITFVQSKTVKTITLPLLPSVGNAIIDYLKNARRECNLSNIFVNIKGPVMPITSSAVYGIISRYLHAAGIEDLDKRKHGPHALRHSLATKLLSNGNDLATISSILGHSSSQVTTVYLSIDYENLKKCSIPIPPIASMLYTQREV